MPSNKKKNSQDLVAAAAMRSSLERVPTTMPLNPNITRSSVIALHVGALVAL
jgi:hypothetical protein